MKPSSLQIYFLIRQTMIVDRVELKQKVTVSQTKLILRRWSVASKPSLFPTLCFMPKSEQMNEPSDPQPQMAAIRLSSTRSHQTHTHRRMYISHIITTHKWKECVSTVSVSSCRHAGEKQQKQKQKIIKITKNPQKKKLAPSRTLTCQRLHFGQTN